MKQHITTKQLNELSDKRKERLRKWWKPQLGDWFSIYTNQWIDKDKGFFEEYLCEYLPDVLPKEIKEKQNIYDEWGKLYPLLSIGQMIDFLGDDIAEEFIYAQWDSNSNCSSWVVNASEKSYRNKELCDALWLAVKELLNNNK